MKIFPFFVPIISNSSTFPGSISLPDSGMMPIQEEKKRGRRDSKSRNQKKRKRSTEPFNLSRRYFKERDFWVLTVLILMSSIAAISAPV